MSVPQQFIDFVNEQVKRYKETFGIVSNRHAFASWALEFIHPLSEDEAYEQTDTLHKGDGGLDGWFYDKSEKLFHLHQVKYPDDTFEDIGPEPVRDLFSALHIVSDYKTAKDRSEKLGRISTEFLEAIDNEVKVVLNCIVFAQLTQETETEFFNKCNSHELTPKGEIWDINRLYDLYVSRETVEDLSGTEITIPLNTGCFMEVERPLTEEVIDKSVVVNFNLKSFIREIKNYNPKIFGLNVRFHLGHQNNVNTKISETLTGVHKYFKSDLFWHYNNGITILVDHFEITNEGPNLIKLENPQIVNGCQTVSTLINKYSDIPDHLMILARVIKVSNTPKGKEEAVFISEATNSQSPVKLSDLKANDKVQKQIQANFKSLPQPFHYERKRGEWKALGRAEKARFGSRRVNMIDIGQSWYSYVGKPANAISSKDNIFADEDIYTKVYKKERDVREYLLAQILFNLYNSIFASSKLTEIQFFVEDFDAGTLNRLLRAKKLTVAHCVALSKYILELRFKKLDGKASSQIIDLLENDSSFKEKLFTLVLGEISDFVVSRGPETDIRSFLKDENESTLADLQLKLNKSLRTLKVAGASLLTMFNDLSE